MTITGIDHASLVVVDDVYADFERARAAALGCAFTPRTDSAFAYRTAPAPRWMEEEAIGRICEVLGPGSREELIANHLHMSSTMDWKVNLHRGARIHVDEARWAGVLYLNTAEQCRGGTSLYAHRRTGVRHFFELRGRPDAQEILADGGDIANWQELVSLTMVPNRLVLFDPGQFHQAQEYFGDSKSSARLIHNFFFRHIPAHFDPDRDGAGAAGVMGRAVNR
ncbi:DUF6445 family protein [Streptomyces sp. NPDC085942]|uniref:DUF6445 family protein n=1 Tax=Streptomyces sp. NPDC085942 TaxID=3365743 RepID=UPI0037D160CB